MHTSSVLASLALALLSSKVLATPPACLLACVAEVSKNSNKCNALNEIGCICGESDNIHSCLNNRCPNGNADAAWNSFQGSCQNKQSGSSSSSSSASSSSTSSTSTSSKASSTSSSSAHPSTNAAHSSSPAHSSSSAHPSTNAAHSSSPAHSSSSAPSSTSSPSATKQAEETHAVTSTNGQKPAQTNEVEVTQYSTVVDGVTEHSTFTSTAPAVTVQGGIVTKTKIVSCSTTLEKRDATQTISSSSSSGAANNLQVGSAAMLAAAALLI